jgi:hypothetical protein
MDQQQAEQNRAYKAAEASHLRDLVEELGASDDPLLARVTIWVGSTNRNAIKSHTNVVIM